MSESNLCCARARSAGFCTGQLTILVGLMGLGRPQTRQTTHLSKKAGGVGAGGDVLALLVVILVALSNVLNGGLAEVSGTVCEDLIVEGGVLRGGSDVEGCLWAVDLL